MKTKQSNTNTIIEHSYVLQNWSDVIKNAIMNDFTSNRNLITHLPPPPVMLLKSIIFIL